MYRRLTRHPAFECPPVRRIEASASRSEPRRLEVGFRLIGDLSQLTIPAATAPLRTDELWKHTCFEAFVRPAGGEAYGEFNLAPSSRWAAYRFDGYRAGMAPAKALSLPVIGAGQGDEVFDLSASLSFDTLPADIAWEVALSAVIEAKDGSLSYWALKHDSAEKPDFHAAAGFTFTLAPNG